MRATPSVLILGVFMLALPVSADDPPPLSEATEACLMCHEFLHPGIVAGWRSSRHADVTPAEASAVEGLGRKVSSDDIPENLAGVVVGCAECPTLRPDDHDGVFDHNDFRVHSVVSPGDCAVCHAVEANQYAGNIMSHAHGNLEGNALYQDLEKHILGAPVLDEGRLTFQPPDPATEAVVPRRAPVQSSMRSSIITLFHAATKSSTNFRFASLEA